MTAKRVFVGSSTEGLAVATIVKEMLEAELRELVVVETWNRGTFGPSESYIGGLESELQSADFAVLVLTPDDEAVIRTAKEAVPRDNVLFELGLFMGRLGRERVFYIGPKGLKLPTDLLGIESPQFELTADTDNWRRELGLACKPIAQAIHDGLAGMLPSLAKLTDAELAAQRERRTFYDRIAGPWWERITWQGAVKGTREPHDPGRQVESAEEALSIFMIAADDAHNSIRLAEGHAYDGEGVHRASWHSAAARLEHEAGRIVYVRNCRRDDVKKTDWLPGFGKVDFELPADSRGPISTGSGFFWESDDATPDEALVKRVKIRRFRETENPSVIKEGSTKDRKRLIQKVLTRWPT